MVKDKTIHLYEPHMAHIMEIQECLAPILVFHLLKFQLLSENEK